MNNICMMYTYPSIWKPFNTTGDMENIINLLRISKINMNNKGDSGKPYLRPLPGLKKDEANPFIRTTKLTVWKHERI